MVIIYGGLFTGKQRLYKRKTAMTASTRLRSGVYYTIIVFDKMKKQSRHTIVILFRDMFALHSDEC